MDELYDAAIVLFRELTEHIPAPDLRGIGLQMTRLRRVNIENDDDDKTSDIHQEENVISKSKGIPNVVRPLKRQGSMRLERDRSDILDCDDVYVPSQLDNTVVSSLPSPLRKRIYKSKQYVDEVHLNETPTCASTETVQFTQVLLLCC